MWDVTTGKPVWSTSLPKKSQVTSVRFAPDGRTIAVTYHLDRPADSTTLVFDTASGKEVRRLVVADYFFHDVRLSHDGRLAVGQGSLRVGEGYRYDRPFAAAFGMLTRTSRWSLGRALLLIPGPR